jgi:DNA-binding HxlR family transcriptional regulator
VKQLHSVKPWPTIEVVATLTKTLPPAREAAPDRAEDEVCPVCATADLVCAKWTILVVRDLADGRSRFCELERSLAGISPRTLSLRLRALEEHGVVERQTYPEVPPRVEYALTEKGRALLPLIEDMRRFGDEWLRTEPRTAA